MKKILSFALCLTLVLSIFSLPFNMVFAADTELTQDHTSDSAVVEYNNLGAGDGSFLVTIPDCIIPVDIGEHRNPYNVSATNVIIPYGTQLNVYVRHNNTVYLQNAFQNKLNYNMFNGVNEYAETIVENGDGILSIPAGQVDGGSTVVSAELTQSPLYAGVYVGTATFYIDVDLPDALTPHQITMNPSIFGIGKTKAEYVVAEFNDDFSEVTIRKNGQDSDGKTRDFNSKNSQSDDYVDDFDEFCLQKFGMTQQEIYDKYPINEIQDKAYDKYFKGKVGVSYEEWETYKTQIENNVLTDEFYDDIYVEKTGKTKDEIDALISYYESTNFDDVLASEMDTNISQDAVAAGIVDGNGDPLVSSDEMYAWAADWIAAHPQYALFESSMYTTGISLGILDEDYNLLVSLDEAHAAMDNYYETNCPNAYAYFEQHPEIVNANPVIIAYAYHDGLIYFHDGEADTVDGVTDDEINEWAIALFKRRLETATNGLLTVDENFNIVATISEEEIMSAARAKLIDATNGRATLSAAGEVVPNITGASFDEEIPYIVDALTNGTLKYDTNNQYNVIGINFTQDEWDGYEPFRFSSFSTLKKVNYAEGIATTGENTFRDCSSLEEIYLPTSLGQYGLEYNTFVQCYNIKKIVAPSNISYWSYDASRINSSTELEEVVMMNASNGVLSAVPVASDKTSAVHYTLGTGLNQVTDYLFNGFTNATFSMVTPLKSVGGNAFYGCEGLGELDLSKLESVGSSAFYNSGLSGLANLESLKNISSAAFGGTNLSRVVISDDIESVGDSAFYNCYSLANLTIPCDYKYSTSTFACENENNTERTITLTAGKTGIMPEYYDVQEQYNDRRSPFGAISSNIKSVNLVISDGVVEIGKYAFVNAQNIKSITFSDSEDLKTIHEWAFSKAFSPTASFNLVIPDGVECAAREAFSENPGIVSVYIPNTLQKFYIEPASTVNYWSQITNSSGDLFFGCTGLKTVVFEDYEPDAVPDSFIATHYTSDGSGYYNGMPKVSSYSTAARYMFSECSSLTSIHLPNGMQVIPEYFFQNCSSLETIDLPEELECLGECSFLGAPIKNIVLPDSVAFIDTSAFTCDTSVTTMYLGENLHHFKGFMQGCSNLKELSMPLDIYVTFVSDGGYQGFRQGTLSKCDGYTLTLNNETGVFELTDCKFKSFNKFAGSINFNGVDYSGCTELEKVTILKGPNDATSDLYSPDNTMCLPWYVAKDSVKEIVFEDGIKYIGSYNLYGNTVLESITIPESVTKINANAFVEINDDVVIKCVQNSYADTWAQAAGYATQYIG